MADDRIFDSDEHRLFNRLEKAIDRAVERVCDRHVGRTRRGGEEEPPISARIAEAIETELEHQSAEIGAMRVEVVTHNARNTGETSQETLTGVDLLISIVRWDGRKPTSKSVIIQSKLETRLDDDPKRLRNQANRMRTRTKESYVAVIGSDGAKIVRAKRATYPKLPDDFTAEGISFGQLVTDSLRCNRGDRRIGRDPELSVPEGLGVLMDELKAWRGIGFTIATTRKR